MNKQDKIFIFLVIICLSFLATIMVQNLSAQTRGPLPESSAEIQGTSSAYDPERSEALRKKFEAMGLRPHEGKYWK